MAGDLNNDNNNNNNNNIVITGKGYWKCTKYYSKECRRKNRGN